MRSIAEAHGLKVHVDTSPHLVRVNERIRIAGELITDDDLRRYVKQVLDANNGEPLSFFEGMTIASYLAFAEHSADLTIVEVGLGGRFDSTNVIPNPKVCVHIVGFFAEGVAGRAFLGGLHLSDHANVDVRDEADEKRVALVGVLKVLREEGCETSDAT